MSEIYQIYAITSTTDNSGNETKKHLGTWEKRGNEIKSAYHDGEWMQIEGNDSIEDTIRKSGNCSHYWNRQDENTNVSVRAERTNQKKGGYYPRIFAPTLLPIPYMNRAQIIADMSKQRGTEYPSDPNHLINSLVQLQTLIDSTKRIFRTIYPCEDNMNAFGFDIRNILILACTEFETQIAGVLKANDIQPQGSFYITKDYFKLKNIMKLGDYEVKFSLYPDITSSKPFLYWSAESPTQSLEWYANYNAVKHDRDANFNKGRIKDLVNSLSACYIILLAQYGELPSINESLQDFFTLKSRPSWDKSEIYIEPKRNDDWERVNFRSEEA